MNIVDYECNLFNDFYNSYILEGFSPFIAKFLAKRDIKKDYTLQKLKTEEAKEIKWQYMIDGYLNANLKSKHRRYKRRNCHEFCFDFASLENIFYMALAIIFVSGTVLAFTSIFTYFVWNSCIAKLFSVQPFTLGQTIFIAVLFAGNTCSILFKKTKF